jgi:hypothetical protein
MKKLMYLFVAAIMFVFTACSGDKTPAQEADDVKANEEAVEEVVVEDTTAAEEAEPAEEADTAEEAAE